MPDNSNSPALLAHFRAEPRGPWLPWLHLSVILLSCVCLTGSTGCTSMGLWPSHSGGRLTRIDPPVTAEATAEEILALVNRNAYSEFSPSGLHSFRSDNLSVRMKGVPAVMRASMVVEAPRNLRLRVANPVTGGEAVDIGSNDERFWAWIKDSPQRNVITCSHDHVSIASKVCPMPLPFRPDWLMEVLGVVPISGSGYEVHRDKPKSSFVELVSVQRTPDQHPIKRIVKINTLFGVVVEHRVESLDGQMIAKATLFEHYRDPKTQLIMPKVINIDWPVDGQPLALSLELNSVDCNSPAESVAMWSPPEMSDYPELDIGLMAMHQLGISPDELRKQQLGNPPGESTLDNMDLEDAAPFVPEEETQLAAPTEPVLDRIRRSAKSAADSREVYVDPESESDPPQPARELPSEGPVVEESPPEEASAAEARPFPAEL